MAQKVLDNSKNKQGKTFHNIVQQIREEMAVNKQE